MNQPNKDLLAVPVIFRKRDMSIEQFRNVIKEQAEGLLRGAARFQVKMSIAYGLLIPAFDSPVVFYFEKFKKNG